MPWRASHSLGRQTGAQWIVRVSHRKTTPPPPVLCPHRGLIPRVWSRVATDLPNFAHDSWVATDPSAWELDPPPLGLPYWCLCGASFDTLTRLQWHVSGVHPPGSQHSSFLRLLPRIGGSYIIYDPETRAIILCGMARYPISGGGINPALHTPRRVLSFWRSSTPGASFTPITRTLHIRTLFPRCMAGTSRAAP